MYKLIINEMRTPLVSASGRMPSNILPDCGSDMVVHKWIDSAVSNIGPMSVFERPAIFVFRGISFGSLVHTAS